MHLTVHLNVHTRTNTCKDKPRHDGISHFLSSHCNILELCTITHTHMFTHTHTHTHTHTNTYAHTHTLTLTHALEHRNSSAYEVLRHYVGQLLEAKKRVPDAPPPPVTTPMVRWMRAGGGVAHRRVICMCVTCRVGQNRILICTVYDRLLGDFLPIVSYVHHVYNSYMLCIFLFMVLANPSDV
jgi:hypothetical protein